ncbi:MAG TPA: hypothetical protein VJI12_04050 [archaeon]|nr:hypothetical protein [archaeon]
MSNIVAVKIGSKKYRIKDCHNPWGLMLDPMTSKDGALVYYNNIGTFLCRTLDLYFLDKNFRVVEKQQPRHFLDPRSWIGYRSARAKYCLEMKRGVSDIKTGTKIRI